MGCKKRAKGNYRQGEDSVSPAVMNTLTSGARMRRKIPETESRIIWIPWMNERLGKENERMSRTAPQIV